MNIKAGIKKLVISLVVFIAAILIENEVIPIVRIGVFVKDDIVLILFLAAYFIIGGEVVKQAIDNVIHLEMLDENFLMTIATVGAFFVSAYPEAVAVMMFYQVGEMFQSYAVDKSRKSITELMDIRPDYAWVKENDGKVVKKNPEEIKIGQIIVVKPGEKVALDGKIAKGIGSLDTSALTGESLPREAKEGDAVISGSISINAVFEIIVEKEFGQSTVSKILEMVENASNKKASAENFITRFARVYTPIVVALAVILAVIPPLFITFTKGNADWYDWIYRALNFLVISCPCALVISVPLSFFGGLGGASKSGILVKGSNYLEALADCNTIVFDKTGTLTKGKFVVSALNSVEGVDESRLLELAAHAEFFSNHPISISLKEAYKLQEGQHFNKLAEEMKDAQVEEIAGYGVKAEIHAGDIDGVIYAGNKKMLDKINVEYTDFTAIGTAVCIAYNGKYMGYIVIEDEIKEQSAEAINEIKKCGVNRTVMLTGDLNNIAQKVGKSIGIDDVYAELLPGDKVEHVEKLFDEMSEGGKLVFVGDGINDAPVLARADIGVAMGALGSDAAIEAADVVLMDDNPLGIAKAIKIARKTVRIVKENIVFAIGVKVLVLILAAVGLANMWAAVFADVGVSVIAILNALRALRTK